MKRANLIMFLLYYCAAEKC